MIPKLQSGFALLRNETNKFRDEIANLPVQTDVLEINKKLEAFETLVGTISEVANIQLELQLQNIVNAMP